MKLIGGDWKCRTWKYKNDGPNRRAWKRKPWKLSTKSQGLKMQDLKMTDLGISKLPLFVSTRFVLCSQTDQIGLDIFLQSTFSHCRCNYQSISLRLKLLNVYYLKTFLFLQTFFTDRFVFPLSLSSPRPTAQIGRRDDDTYSLLIYFS